MVIKSYKQISTKKGDKGTSSNYSNETYSKDDILFEVLGTIDELSSLLGITYHYVNEFKNSIKEIQRKLQDINSLVATTNELVLVKLKGISNEDISFLENLEEEYMKEVVIEPVFVLPGSDSTKASAYLELSRSVTRRAERALVKFKRELNRIDLDNCLKYLNRLSDLLFIVARK